jgi:hypothetical protein
VEEESYCKQTKTKAHKIDHFDEDLDGKYYIKNKLINRLKNTIRVFFFTENKKSNVSKRTVTIICFESLTRNQTNKK